MTIIAPFDVEGPAVKDYLGPAVGQATQVGGNQGSAGTSAASARNTNATFPHPHADAVPRQDLNCFDINPHRKQRMVLNNRAVGFQVDRRDILDDEHRMRIADVDSNRIDQRPDGYVEMQRIPRLGQRYFLPIMACRTEVDTIMATAGIGDVEKANDRLNA